MIIKNKVVFCNELKGLKHGRTMESPSFMMIVTATGAYAYQRKDGVLVVPIGCLKD